MASNGPSKKFLIVADLDYTHFNTSKQEVTWLGSREFWLDLYGCISEAACSQGIDMLFAVVTKKPNFDDICEVAANDFAVFLTANASSGSDMYQTIKDKRYCLTKVAGNLQYECLAFVEQLEVLNKESVPHFIIEAMAPKSAHIIDLARHYNIALENCLMLDDTPEVLADVRSKGISSVDFECFHPETIENMNLLDNFEYMRSNLLYKREEIFKKVQGIIERIIRQNEEFLKIAMPIPAHSCSYTPLLAAASSSSAASAFDQSQINCKASSETDSFSLIDYTRDPDDCLHSWDGRERIFRKFFKN